MNYDVAFLIGPFPSLPPLEHDRLSVAVARDQIRNRLLAMSVGETAVFYRTFHGRSLFRILDALHVKGSGHWNTRRQGRLSAIRRVG